MPSLELYKNHEVMNIASDMMKQSYEAHELKGGVYDDERTKKIAESIIETCMPHILDFLHEHVMVEASRAYAQDIKDTEEPEPVAVIEGLHVEAKFKHIEFQPINETVYSDRTSGFIVEDYDLFAVMRPQYFDPDPGVIVLNDQVLIPFEHISRFEPSERSVA